ncbi:MAG: TIR domain-containing protein [Pseudomonadota bacterium]
MTDLFISYARGDHQQAGRLAAAMEAAGYSVWWDRQLLSGDEFSAQIEESLKAATAVIVCWSVEASKSRWVRDEASLAADSGKLVAVSLDASDPPIGFRQFHCEDLSGWRGSADNRSIQQLLRAIRAKLDPDASAPVVEAADPSMRPRSWVAAAAALGLIAFLAFGTMFIFQNRDNSNEASDASASIPGVDPVQESAGVRRYGILLPQDAPVTFIGASPLRTPAPALAITPDGQKLIYTGPSSTDTSQLFLRDLSEFAVTAIPGTGGAYHPFVSPDGDKVAFFAEDELRIAPLDGGTVRTVLATPNPQGGAWWGNDKIIYSDREGRFTWWVSINNPTPNAFTLAEPTMPDGARIEYSTIMRPMPGGETVLTVAYPGIETFGRLVALDPARGTLETIIDLAVSGWASNRALVYVMANELFAVDFDNATNQVSGEPRLLGGELRRDATLPQFVLSDQTLIYATGGPYLQLQIARVGLDGSISKTAIADERFGNLAVSPDGRQVAATVYGNQTDIYLYDMESGESRRLTRGGGNHHPEWAEDGDTLYFAHEGSDEPQGVYRTSTSSAGFEKSLFLETKSYLVRMSANNLAAMSVPGEGGLDYAVVDLKTAEQTLIAQQPDVEEDLGHASPDHRWMALTVDASGRYEVVVMPLFRDGPTIPVSTQGGEEPTWSDDMSSLYYRYGTRLFRVPVSQNDGELVLGQAEIVLDDPRWVNVGGYSYWPDPGTGGFLILRDNQPPTARELRVVEGWRSLR